MLYWIVSVGSGNNIIVSPKKCMNSDEKEEEAVVLRREMGSLKSQAEKLRPRQEFAAEKTNFHLLQFGKISCRQICVALIAKLPREIRDLIYEHFNKHDDVHIYDITGTSSYWPSYALKTVQPRPDWPNITPDYPHYWDPEYTGHEMKSELVENWFRLQLSNSHSSSPTYQRSLLAKTL